MTQTHPLPRELQSKTAPKAPLPAQIRGRRDRRVACALSVAEAAALADVSTGTIKAMEGPKGHLTEKTLAALCRGYALAVPDPRLHEAGLRVLARSSTIAGFSRTLMPLLSTDGLAGARLRLAYHAVVKALQLRSVPDDAAVTTLAEAVRTALPPSEAEAVIADLGSGAGNACPAGPARGSGRSGQVSENIRRNVRALRLSRGWSIAHMSRVCVPLDSSLTVDSLANLERGADNGRRPARRITADDLYTLAQVLEVPASFLVDRSACPTCVGRPPKGFTCNACGAGDGHDHVWSPTATNEGLRPVLQT